MIGLSRFHAVRDSFRSTGARNRSRRAVGVLTVCLAALFGAGVALAGDEPLFDRDALGGGSYQQGPAAGGKSTVEALDPIYRKGRLEFGLESLYTFGNVPNPFFALANRKFINPIQYRVATQVLSVRYQLYNPCGPWFLRGSLEASGNIVGTAILEGPESYFVGFALGLRYYFIQPNARLVPYIEMRSGPGQIDSEGSHFAQQQDLAFTYLAGVGLRYDVDKHWSATLSMTDQHFSNGYLATPNNGVDTLGVNLGVIHRF